MKKTMIALTLLLVAAMSPAAVIVTNGDMEINALAHDGDNVWTPPTGWVGNVTGGLVGVVGETRDFVTDDTTTPSDVAWMVVYATDSEGGQNIGDIASNLGKTIEVTYDLTRRANEANNWNHRVRLYAGDGSGWTMASDSADPDADLSDAFLAEATAVVTGVANTAIPQTIQLTLPDTYTGSLTNLYLAFKNSGTGSSIAQLMFDDVTATVVPEPATMSLLVLGGIAMLKRRKK